MAAVEDQLGSLMCETVAFLRAPDIQQWALMGDKRETEESICHMAPQLAPSVRVAHVAADLHNTREGRLQAILGLVRGTFSQGRRLSQLTEWGGIATATAIMPGGALPPIAPTCGHFRAHARFTSVRARRVGAATLSLGRHCGRGCGGLV